MKQLCNKFSPISIAAFFLLLAITIACIVLLMDRFLVARSNDLTKEDSQKIVGKSTSHIKAPPASQSGLLIDHSQVQDFVRDGVAMFGVGWLVTPRTQHLFHLSKFECDKIRNLYNEADGKLRILEAKSASIVSENARITRININPYPDVGNGVRVWLESELNNILNSNTKTWFKLANYAHISGLDNFGDFSEKEILVVFPPATNADGAEITIESSVVHREPGLPKTGKRYAGKSVPPYFAHIVKIIPTVDQE